MGIEPTATQIKNLALSLLSYEGFSTEGRMEHMQTRSQGGTWLVVRVRARETCAFPSRFSEPVQR